MVFCVTCFCEVAACNPRVVLLTNVDQAWKKIEECGNLVAENMAKMRTSKVQSGPAPTTSHNRGYKL